MVRPLILHSSLSNDIADRMAQLACFVSEYDADNVHLRPRNSLSLPAYIAYRTNRIVPMNLPAVLIHRLPFYRFLLAAPNNSQ